MAQTDYSVFRDIGFEGSIATGYGPYSARGTYGEFVNGGTARLPYGRVVIAGTADGEVVLPSSDGQTPIGITVQQHAYEKAEDGTDGIPVDRPATILKRGVILMVAEEDIDASADSPFFRYDAQNSAGDFDAIGRIRTDVNNDAGGDNADALANNSKFLKDAAAGEIVPVYVDFGG